MLTPTKTIWTTHLHNKTIFTNHVQHKMNLYVAVDKRFFEKNGVAVEMIPFNTASEKDIALSAGAIDGYFGDLVTPLVLKGNGRNIVIVAANYDTRHDRRMFAVLGKPGGPYKSAGDLASIPVAVSSNSVIHFFTESLLKKNGVPAEKIEFLESKNIGLRMQMLLTGQVEAATLPEPLVTAAAAKGAVVLADDSGLATSQTVLVFAQPFAERHKSAVNSFLRAVAEAAELINQQPDAVRAIMVEHVRLPEPLKQSYPVPRFPKLGVPDKQALETIATWLRDRKVINSTVEFGNVVDGSFLP
jgi:NitT/TauT family transport system substrate-binding protein